MTYLNLQTFEKSKYKVLSYKERLNILGWYEQEDGVWKIVAGVRSVIFEEKENNEE